MPSPDDFFQKIIGALRPINTQALPKQIQKEWNAINLSSRIVLFLSLSLSLDTYMETGGCLGNVQPFHN